MHYPLPAQEMEHLAFAMSLNRVSYSAENHENHTNIRKSFPEG